MTIDADPSGDPSDPESVRRSYLRQESNVKSIGQLCYLVAFISALGTLEFFLFARGVFPQSPELKRLVDPALIQVFYWVMTATFALITLGHIPLGYGMTHLQAWARWTVVALTAMSLASHTGLSLAICAIYPIGGLLSLVIGGLIHGLILYPLLNTGAGVVFSTAYKGVIRRTPGIKSRMSWLLKLLIGLILGGVVGLVGAVYYGLIDFRIFD